MSSITLHKLRKRIPVEEPEKPRKKADRFDGLSEEEIQKYSLPDYLETDLDIVFVGINPSLMAAYRGRYYAGPGNHFYKLLHASGLTPRCLSYEEDYKLLKYGIGLTNIVTRPTKSSSELKRTELKEGSQIVMEKLKTYRPKIAVFNGKCIYDVFASKISNFNFGLQQERMGETAFWVTPSSSARCANFPRMVDKLHFFTSLKKYLQYSKGEITNVDLKEFSFDGKCQPFIPRTSKMWRRKDMSAFLHGGRIANKDTICLDTSDENVAIAYSTEFIVKRLESDENEKSDEVSDTNESKPSKNFKAPSTESNPIIHIKNNECPEAKSSQIVNGTKTGKHKRKPAISKTVKSDMLICKDQVNNNTKKKHVKKLISKPIKNNDLERGTEFINLIKQRLSNKIDNTE